MFRSAFVKSLALVSWLWILSVGCTLRPATPQPVAPPPAASATPVGPPTPCLPWVFPNLIEACPTGPARQYVGSTRLFERGFAIWLSNPDRFYVFFDDPEQVYLLIAEPYTWQMGEPNIPPAPSGFYAPSGGFDYLWRGAINTHTRQYNNLRERLGWSTEGPERLYASDYQCVTPANYWEQQCLMLDSLGNVILLKPSPAKSPAGVWQVVEQRP